MVQWLGRRTCYPKAPGSSPALNTWICFTVVLFSNPRPPSVNSQLVGLPPDGILNKYYVQLTYLVQSVIMSSISTIVLNTLALNKVIIIVNENDVLF